MSKKNLGKCPSCGRDIRVRTKKVRTGMDVECDCGWRGVPSRGPNAPARVAAVLTELTEAGKFRRSLADRRKRYTIGWRMEKENKKPLYLLHLRALVSAVQNFQHQVVSGEVSHPSEAKGCGIALIRLSYCELFDEEEQDKFTGSVVNFAFTGYLVAASKSASENISKFERCYVEFFECLGQLVPSMIEVKAPLNIPGLQNP